MTTVLTETKVSAMTATSVWPTLATFITRHADILAAALATVAAVALLYPLYRAIRAGRPDKWIAGVAWVAAFGFSAEGMWVVATQKAHVPALVAAGVFFVGEAMQITSMTQASRRYAVDKHPGKHGRAVWIIAVAMGVIVSFAATNTAERLLRFAIPLGTALLWWNTLTDAGCAKRPTRLRWTPVRLLERLGALEPDVDRDLAEADRQRRVAAMTVAAHRVHAGGRHRRIHAARLRRLALAADDGMVAEVRERVQRVQRIVALTAPVPPVVPVSVQAEVPAEGSAQLAAGVPAQVPPLVPAEVPPARTPEVPAATSARRSAGTSTGGSARKPARKKPEAPPRRSADETRKLAAELQLADPSLTQAQIAAQLRISDRRLREVLAEPAKTNGHAVPDLIPTGGMS